MKTIVNIGDGWMTRTRFIKPLAGNLMIRFDVDVNIKQGSAELHNVLFYERGNKAQEKKALDGD